MLSGNGVRGIKSHQAARRDKGKAAYYHHEQFHRQMIKNVADEMNDSEKEILVFALAKLVDYFKLTYYDTDEESEFVDWSKISRDK